MPLTKDCDVCPADMCVCERKPKYSIGTRFKTRHKVPRHCEVVDIFKTYNNAMELVAIRYVAKHVFIGQTVVDCDVVETTITMGLLE